MNSVATASNAVSFGHTKYLTLYPSSRQCIAEAFSDGDTSRFLVLDFPHPFQEPQPRHLTREHAVVFATQALCVHVGAMAELTKLTPFSGPEFIRALDNEHALIKEISVKFHRFVKRASAVEIVVSTTRHVRSKHFFILEASYSIAGGGCTGAIKGVMRL